MSSEAAVTTGARRAVARHHHRVPRSASRSRRGLPAVTLQEGGTPLLPAPCALPAAPRAATCT